MNLHRNSDILQRINDFFYTPYYFLALGLLTVLANTCGLELVIYFFVTAIVVYNCFFGRDLLPLMPVAICCYIAPSRSNNPGINTESVFSFSSGGAVIIAFAVIIAISLIYFIVVNRSKGKEFIKCKRKLLWGMLILGVGYFLSGIGSGQLKRIGGNNLLFAFIQFVSVFAMYFLFTGTVDWKKAPKNYLAQTGILIGYILIAELIFIYITCDVLTTGIINRDNIFTGWGHYNNIGALLAMALPFPFFMALNSDNVGKYYLTALVFMTGIIFTCSRGSILFGVIIFACCFITLLIKGHRTRTNAVIYIATAVVILAGVVIFSKELLNLFNAFLELKTNPGDRYNGYKAGVKQFLDYPIFGGSFYPTEYDLYSWSTSDAFTSFFPPRWHNTFLQMLASCGVVGFINYCVHRVNTFVLFFKKASAEKTMVFFSVLALLLTSVIDCHFFNVGPAMFYSIILAFVEKKLSYNEIILENHIETEEIKPRAIV